MWELTEFLHIKNCSQFRGIPKDVIRSFKFAAAQMKIILSLVFQERRDTYYRGTVGKGFHYSFIHSTNIYWALLSVSYLLFQEHVVSKLENDPLVESAYLSTGDNEQCHDSQTAIKIPQKLVSCFQLSICNNWHSNFFLTTKY